MRLHPLTLVLLVAGTLQAQVGLHQGKPDTLPPPNPRGSDGWSNTTGSATDAVSQLEAISGQKIDRSKVSTRFHLAKPKPPSPNQQAQALLVGFVGQLFAQALAPTPSGPDPAEQARLEAERQAALQRQQAELTAWAQAYTQRMGAILDQQRREREARNQTSLEGLRASLSDGWDNGTAPAVGNGLVSALSDPTPVVDLHAKVDLSVTQAGIPSLLRHADGTKRTQPLSVDELIRRREEAQARLKAMMAENQDLRLLGSRFYELEAQLDLLKKEIERQRSQGRALQRELDLWGWRIEQASQACLERGLSLFADILVPKGTKAGLDRLKKNPERWRQTVQSLSEINEFSEFASSLVDRYDAAGQALDWIQAKRNLFRDLDFVASNLGNLTSKLEAVSLHWRVGKDLLATGIDLATVVDGWGAILERQGDLDLLIQKQKALQPRLESVVRDLKAHRAQIAQRLGVNPEDLLPPPQRPDRLGYPVPPP